MSNQPSAPDPTRSTLLFTNTRSQAEIWFRTLVRTRPDLIGSIALHHGSLDVSQRREPRSYFRFDPPDPKLIIVREPTNPFEILSNQRSLPLRGHDARASADRDR